jgi:hypothetical protein
MIKSKRSGPSLIECLKKGLERIRFPGTQSGTVEVTVKVIFDR